MAEWIRVNSEDNDFTRRMKWLSGQQTGSSDQSQSSGQTPGREQQAFQNYQSIRNMAITNSLDLNTASGVEAYIWKNYSGTEREAAYAQLDLAYNTKGSGLYDPYHKKVTNQTYIDTLKGLGVEVPDVVTTDWVNQMSQQYSPYYNINPQSGNPNTVKKNAPVEQKIAYNIWQLQQDEDTTQKAEAEWADMKSRIQYWTNKGLSDDEIKAKIDMKKYPTLAKMDESRTAGNYIPMNRQVGYSQDAINGVIWKARNGYGDDVDDFDAAVRANLRQGKSDRSTSRQIAQRTVGTSEYNPYLNGSNDDDARMAAGVDRWDLQWLRDNQEKMFAEGKGDLWNQMYKDQQNYEAAKKEHDILTKWVSDYQYDFEFTSYEDMVKKLSDDLDDRLNNTSGLYFDEDFNTAPKLKALLDMDEGRRTGKPVALSDELNYRREDVLAEMVQRYFRANGITINRDQAMWASQNAEEMDREQAKEEKKAAESKAEESKAEESKPEQSTVKAPVSNVEETNLRILSGEDPELVLNEPEHIEGTEANPSWKLQYGDRIDEYKKNHPSNNAFHNDFCVPIINMEGLSGSNSIRNAPRLADSGVSDVSEKKVPEQQYLSTKTGAVYTRSDLKNALVNNFIGLKPNEAEQDIISMLNSSVRWAFDPLKVTAALGVRLVQFGNEAEMILKAKAASESGYATAENQADLVLAFFDDASAASAEGMNIGHYYKVHPEAYDDVQSIVDAIYNRRDTQIAEDAQKDEQAKADRLATAQGIVDKVSTGAELTQDEMALLQTVMPTGDYKETDAYLHSKSETSQYLKSIGYDDTVEELQDQWIAEQRERAEAAGEWFTADAGYNALVQAEGIVDLMEQGIVFDAKLAESAGMTLEEYYQKTGNPLDLQARFEQAQASWEAREAPENRTDEQNTGIGLLGLWGAVSGVKMGTIDVAQGYVGFASDVVDLATGGYQNTKLLWTNYIGTFNANVGAYETRSSYRTAVLKYANGLQDSDPERAQSIRDTVAEALANGEDIFNINFNITLDKLERAYETLGDINEAEMEYVNTHATEGEKKFVKWTRSAAASTERMAISAGLSALGAPGWAAGAIAFAPGSFDSAYRAEVAANGGDKTSAAVYAGISALIDTITEQSFMSKWYNIGGEAAQSWLFNLQRKQLSMIGPAGTAGNLAHRAAAYMLGWLGTQSAEVLQEIGQDGINTIWDGLYHQRDREWFLNEFDFISNPEAREKLADTIMSTVLSVGLSYNSQQILGRNGINREGTGATAFSSYGTIQDNIRIGNMMKNQFDAEKANQVALDQDTTGVTADLEDAEPDVVFPETPAGEKYKQTEMEGLGEKDKNARKRQKAREAREAKMAAGAPDERVSPGQISMQDYYENIYGTPYQQMTMPGMEDAQESPSIADAELTDPRMENAKPEVVPGQISMEQYADDQDAAFELALEAGPGKGYQQQEMKGLGRKGTPRQTNKEINEEYYDEGRSEGQTSFLNDVDMLSGNKPDFVVEAENKLNDLRTSISERLEALDILRIVKDQINGLGEAAAGTIEDIRAGLQIALEMIRDGSNRGVNQGLEISDSILENIEETSTLATVQQLEDELTGQVGALTIQTSETLRDADLKAALYAMYTVPSVREEIIRNLADQYTAEAILAGRLTEDPDVQAAVTATQEAKSELDEATAEEKRAEANAQSAQQNLENAAANRGQEGWTPNQEIAAAKATSEAKKNLDKAKEKTKKATSKYNKAKNASDKKMQAKHAALENESHVLADAQVNEEKRVLLANIEHDDGPVVPPTSQTENAEPTATIRSAEEQANLDTEAQAEVDRVNQLPVGEDQAEIDKINADMKEEAPAEQPQPIQSNVGNRLREEAVNEKGKALLTKTQMDSIERAVIANEELNEFFQGLSTEDLNRFVNDFLTNRTKRSRTDGFMRNWMTTEQQNKAAAEAGVDKAQIVKDLRKAIRKAIKNKDQAAYDAAMEKYVDANEGLFDIEEGDDYITIDDETIYFHGAFDSAESRQMATADDEDLYSGTESQADTQLERMALGEEYTPDVEKQVENLLGDQETDETETEGKTEQTDPRLDQPKPTPEASAETAAPEQTTAETDTEQTAPEAETATSPVEDQQTPATEQPTEATTETEQPKTEAKKPRKKSTPKTKAPKAKAAPAIDALTEDMPNDLKAAVMADEKAKAIVERIEVAQEKYSETKEAFRKAKGKDMYAAQKAMDDQKTNVDELTNEFNKRVRNLQKRLENDLRAESRKNTDRSEENYAKIKELADGIAKRVTAIFDQFHRSRGVDRQPMGYKRTQQLLPDLRSMLDVGLSRIENDLTTNDVGTLNNIIKDLTPAFDAINSLAELAGEEPLPGSISMLRTAFAKAIKSYVASRSELANAKTLTDENAANAVTEATNAVKAAKEKLLATRNKLMAYATDLDGMLDRMQKKYAPNATESYNALDRPGRRDDIQRNEETTAKQSPLATFQRLANDIGVGHYDVDKKNVPRGALGYYKPFADAIGIGRNHANDAYVTMHEIGHALEERIGFHGTDDMVKAADPALMRRYIAYGPAVMRSEAVAEFVRTYMMDRDSAIRTFGQNVVDQFESSAQASGIWNDIKRCATEIHNYTMANPHSQIRSRMTNWQHKTQPKGLKRTIHDGIRDTIMHEVDDTFAAYDFDKIVGNKNKGDLSLRERLRFLKFGARQGRSMITRGFVTPSGHILRESFAQTISEDLQTGETLLSTTEDFDNLSMYMLCLQAETRYKNAIADLPLNASAADIQAATANSTVFGSDIDINDIQQEIAEMKLNHPEVVKAQEQLESWWHDFMRTWMTEAGISSRTIEDLIEKYPHYCPTQRNMPNGTTGRNTNNSSSSNWAFGFKTIKGSDLDVINPLVTMQSTICKTVEAARRNEAMGAIVEALQTSGNLGEYARIIPGDIVASNVHTATIQDEMKKAYIKAASAGMVPVGASSIVDAVSMFVNDVTQYTRTHYTNEPNTIAYQNDGKITLVKFEDPALYDAVMAGNPDVGPIIQTVGKLTRNMSLLTTGMNILFTAKNLVRDYQQGTVWGSWNSSIVSPVGLAKWVAAAVEVVRGEIDEATHGKHGSTSKHLAEYKSMGGEGYGSINMPTSERQSNDLMRNLYEMYGMNPAQKVGHGFYDKTIGLIDTINGVIEQTTRYVEYRYGKHDLSTEEGRTKAFLAAQDATVDFARHGNSKVAAAMRAMIPFYNASMQGTWQVFDAAIDPDQRSRLAPRAAKLALNNLILGAMAYMGLQMLGSDEDKEWYERLPLSIRLDNIIIPFKDSNSAARQFIRVPVAQNWASRAFYAAGLALARGNNGDEDGMAILDIAGNILGNWLTTDFIFAPELSVITNKTWTGSTLVSSRLQDGRRASEQFNQTTPELFKALSRLLSQAPVPIEISPIALQYLAQQHSGILGQVLIPAMSPDSLDNYQLNPLKQVLRTIRNSWTIDPAYTNDVNDAYYEGLSMLNGIVGAASDNGYSDYLSTNLTPEDAQIAVDTAAQLTGTYGALTTIKTKIKEITAAQQAILEDTTLSSDEKEVQRRNLQRQIVELEEKGVGIINGYREQFCEGTNPIMHTLFGGAHAGKASALANKPPQFLEDYRAGEDYIKTAVDVYTTTGESTIPSPAASITLNKESLKIKAYSNDDGSLIWDDYVNVFRNQYMEAYKTYNWDKLTDQQKVEALKNCNKAANASAKAWFVEWYKTKTR